MDYTSSQPECWPPARGWKQVCINTTHRRRGDRKLTRQLAKLRDPAALTNPSTTLAGHRPLLILAKFNPLEANFQCKSVWCNFALKGYFHLQVATQRTMLACSWPIISFGGSHGMQHLIILVFAGMFGIIQASGDDGQDDVWWSEWPDMNGGWSQSTTIHRTVVTHGRLAPARGQTTLPHGICSHKFWSICRDWVDDFQCLGEFILPKKT